MEDSSNTSTPKHEEALMTQHPTSSLVELLKEK